MKRFLFIFVITLAHYAMHAQTLLWLNTTCATLNVAGGQGIATDSSGNSYCTGFFTGTVDFDPGAGITNLTSNGGEDIYIVKYDPAGALLWALSVGGTSGNDWANAIALDADNHVVITGRFASDSMDCDPGVQPFYIHNAGVTDAYVAKYDSAGNFLNAFCIGGTNMEMGNAIETDSSNNIIVCGYMFSSNVDFDPSAASWPLSSAGSGDAFVAKYDSAGVLLFAFRIGGSGSEEARDVAIDRDGNILITGNFQTPTMDFNPGPATNNVACSGSDDAYVAKYSPGGAYLWAFKIGAVSNQLGEGIAVDSSNHVYVTGVFSPSVDFDPGAATYMLTSNGSGDGFLASYDSTGAFVFAFGFGGTLLDEGWDLDVSEQQEVLVTGFLWGGTVDLDPGPGTFLVSTYGNFDLFCAKYDTTGAFISGFCAGGSQEDRGNSIAAAPGGDIVVAGYFESSGMDFDPGAAQNIPAGCGSDYFVARYHDLSEPLAVDAAVAAPAITVYPNPAQNTLTVALSPNTGACTVFIESVSGQILFEQTCQSQTMLSLDVSHFSEGMYFVSVVDWNGATSVQRVVISR